MNSAQWLFEYLALREKERIEEEGQVELANQVIIASKKLLINLLGLNIIPKKITGEVKDGEDEEDDRFIPLSLMTAREDVLSHMLEQLDQERAVEDVMEDDEFEKMSQAIAKGEDLGDMAPLFEVDEELGQQLDQWFTPMREDELRSLGIKITEEPIKKEVAHVNIDGNLIRQKKRDQAMERKMAQEEVEKQIEEEKKRTKPKGVKVTFDDA